MHWTNTFFFWAIFVPLGCMEQPKPEADVPIPIAKAVALDIHSSTSETEPHRVSVGGFQFMVPAGWQQQPPKSEFVLGEFTLPGVGGSARLTLSSAGGGIEANIERWRGQFRRGPNDAESRESTITFDGRRSSLVEISGTYSDMFNGRQPSPQWRMLGLAAPLGPTNFFIKLTGPLATVIDQKDAFLQFAESATSAN